MGSVQKIVENIERVIVGKREVIELLSIALICRGHVLIEDVPGVGKTTLAGALAKSVSGRLKRIQFTPDVLPSDLTGFSMYNQKTGEFEYKAGTLSGEFILADEINRTSPKTQASLLEAMEERQVTVDGVTYKMPKTFMVLATQNPVDYLGTFPLPEAQMDRFLMKVSIGYPSVRDEEKMLAKYKEDNPLHTLQPVISSEELLQIQEQVSKIYVEESLYSLIVEIVRQTRVHKDVLLGVSPRGALSLLHAAQGLAFFNGRDYILPDDIIKMAPYVLSHRIQLKHEAKLRNKANEDIIHYILEEIRLPKVKAYAEK